MNEAFKGIKDNLTQIYWNLVPTLILIFTFCLPLLHLKKSRIYNHQIATVQLLIIIIAFIIYRSSLFRFFTKKSRDKTLIYIFLISGLISTIGSDFFKYSMERYLSIIVWFSYFWLLVFLIKEKNIKPASLIFITSISTVIPIIHLLILYFSKSEPINIYHLVNELYYYSNIRHFGYHLTIVTLLSLYFIPSKFFPAKLFGILLFTLNFSVLNLTASRQGVGIILLLAIPLFLYFFRHNGLYKNLIYGLTSITILFTTILFFNIELLIVKRMSDLIDNSYDIITFLGARADIWEASFQAINKKWFFGIGPETLSHLENINFPSHLVQPHSIVFQSLTSWGLIGYFLLFSIFGRLFYLSILTINKQSLEQRLSPITLTSFIAVTALFLNALIDGTLYHVLPITLFITFSAIIISSVEE